MSIHEGRGLTVIEARKQFIELCKIIAINAIVFCILFASLEFSYRTWLFFSDCNYVCHNTAFFTKLDAFDRDTVYGFMGADPVLGFSPTDGTFKINEPAWNGATITIRQGVRVNPDFEPKSVGGAVLAVGDSFVFGDQVSDDETWPALLERRLNRRVVNGGVSAYGPILAVLRAEQLLKLRHYALVILSILVGEDPQRDRWVNVGLYRRPALIRDEGTFRLTTIEESDKIVSEHFVCAHPRIPELFFWSHVAKRFFSRLGYAGRCATFVHRKGATTDEIIEFTVERFSGLPARKVILLQYPRYSFDGPTRLATRAIDEARKVRNAADHHGVPVIDTYYGLKDRPLDETYIHSYWWPHHSKSGNELVADLIAPSLEERK